MKRIITTVAALAMSLAFITTAEAKKPKGEGKGGDPAAQFAAKDTDKNGFLSKDEFTAGAKDATKAGAHYDKMTKADPKGLTKDEFVAAMAAHKKKAAK